MASTPRAPKQWCLGKNETVTSYESWRQNLLYTLSLDSQFAPFLMEGVTWEKKSKTSPLRGFTADGEEIPENIRRTAQQKVNMLELMLGQVANYCSVISRNTIIKNSTSMAQIWQSIREHFGFQSTGAHFIDFSDIHLDPNERPEDLYQRLVAFVEDSMLTKEANITHHGECVTEDEEMTPTLENFIVLSWLRLIHSDLPRLVKQRYATELRSRTLASIKPEISQALDSLLNELHLSEEAKVMRSAVSEMRGYRRVASQDSQSKPPMKPSRRPVKICPLCKQAGRTEFYHFLSDCSFLPEQDRRYLTKSRLIAKILDEDDTYVPYEGVQDSEHEDQSADRLSASCGLKTCRVQTRQSPYLDTFYGYHAVRITIDSGATGNMIRSSTAKRIGAIVKPTSQSAYQADGSSPLQICGETRLLLERDGKSLVFEGLVVQELDVDVLGGTPFMEANDVAIRPYKRQVLLGDGSVFVYGSPNDSIQKQSVRRVTVLKAPVKKTTVWPGEFLEVVLPQDLAESDSFYALEARHDAPSAKGKKFSQIWPPLTVLPSIAGRIRIPNLTNQPQVLKRHEHFCQVRATCVIEEGETNLPTPDVSIRKLPGKTTVIHSDSVLVDPDCILSQEDRDSFKCLLREYDDVFRPDYKGYNGAFGPFQAHINMGPIEPPKRKGRVPQYARDKLDELQKKFNELEDLGVFVKPEDVGVNVEYLNPSFLVNKAKGGYRLVTAFGDVGRYSKPQPSLMPDVNSILRQIAQWKYIVSADLTSSFYQIPLAEGSRKYCGVATPFRGIRVYARSAMGMPGSETALEEMMCRVLGDLVEEGVVTKIADDLYCGGATPSELQQNWRRVLQALAKSDLCLSPKKTIVCPKSTTILGWKWCMGTIQATPHTISTLSTCMRPDNVKGLRSFIGAYKFLSRVIPGCASILSPLDDAVAGCESLSKISWTEDLCAHFERAQKFLASSKVITLPRPSDQLWIVTDGAVKNHGVGATLYITRGSKVYLSGFFSAKLRGRQMTWIPCEVEALSIAVATKHFSPFIIQSVNKACILTDSKPCVQAYEKLCRGEFSASPRVLTFLSTVSRYQATVRHLAGSANIPSDFASRNASPCQDEQCQVCTFVNYCEQSAVQRVSVQDIVSGRKKLPFTSRNTWKLIQAECSDLRRTHAHLIQGTRPSKKLTNIRDIKRYIQVATVAKDGLLVVQRDEPFTPSHQCIIVPRQVLDGLLTALHIQLDHPSAHQLKAVFRRYLYALDLDKSVNQVTSGCHQCTSLRALQHTPVPQTTGDPPGAVGVSFAADIIKRERQLIFVLREEVTAFTKTCIVENERADSLRDALVCLCLDFRPLDGPLAVIRTDPAPGFVALLNDQVLSKHRLSIELGDAKNSNKNPIAERAIREVREELLRQEPLGGPVTPVTLAVATACLNSRIRSRGLSARELWTQRDQFQNRQIPLTDLDVILKQHEQRLSNHPLSEKSKNPLQKPFLQHNLEVGDIVYLNSDRNKSKARNRYLLVSMDGLWCYVRKFVGSQLRSVSYRVRKYDCYRVPCSFADSSYPVRGELSDGSVSEDEESDKGKSLPPVLPHTPPTLSQPDMGVTHDVGQNAPVEHTSDAEIPDLQGDILADGDSSSNNSFSDLRRSTRVRHRPKYLDDFDTG